MLSVCQASQEGSQIVSGVADRRIYVCRGPHTHGELWPLWNVAGRGLASLRCTHDCTGERLERRTCQIAGKSFQLSLKPKH